MSNQPLLVQEKDSNSVKDKELMEFSLRLLLLIRISSEQLVQPKENSRLRIDLVLKTRNGSVISLSLV